MMKLTLSREDETIIARISATLARNSEIVGMYADFLLNRPRYIQGGDVREIAVSCDVSEAYAYACLLAAAMGMDAELNRRDQSLMREYLFPGIKQCDPLEYQNNSYWQNITFDSHKIGNWSYKTEQYAPYQAFVRDDIVTTRDFVEIPQIGFFSNSFAYPAVLEGENEWMTVTPNEIRTMQGAVEAAHGRVVAFGLGLGYFPYMAACKDSVETVTIIEQSAHAIELFRAYLQGQYPKGKIVLVQADAFEYVRDMHQCDFAFVDLWRDAADGAPLYVRMKAQERAHPQTEFFYWVEASILSRLRWRMHDILRDALDGQAVPLPRNVRVTSAAEFADCLRAPFLRAMAARPGEWFAKL